jgi:hypothetical protein
MFPVPADLDQFSILNCTDDRTRGLTLRTVGPHFQAAALFKQKMPLELKIYYAPALKASHIQDRMGVICALI